MKKLSLIALLGLTACSRSFIMKPEVAPARVVVDIPPAQTEEYPVPSWEEPLDKKLVKTEEVKKHLEEWTYSLMDFVQMSWTKP